MSEDEMAWIGTSHGRLRRPQRAYPTDESGGLRALFGETVSPLKFYSLYAKEYSGLTHVAMCTAHYDLDWLNAHRDRPIVAGQDANDLVIEPCGVLSDEALAQIDAQKQERTAGIYALLFSDQNVPPETGRQQPELPKSDEPKDDHETWADYAHRLEEVIRNQRTHIKDLHALRERSGSKDDRKRIAVLERSLGKVTLELDRRGDHLRALRQKLASEEIGGEA